MNSLTVIIPNYVIYLLAVLAIFQLVSTILSLINFIMKRQLNVAYENGKERLSEIGDEIQQAIHEWLIIKEEGRTLPRFKHFKNGKVYSPIMEGKLEKNLIPHIIYVCEDDNEVWIRPVEEFYGEHSSGKKRFERID